MITRCGSRQSKPHIKCFTALKYFVDFFPFFNFLLHSGCGVVQKGKSQQKMTLSTSEKS